MKKKSVLYKIVTLLMCSILTLGTPVAVFAETENVVVTEVSDTSESSSEVSEPTSEPSGESKPASGELASESTSEPVEETVPAQEPAAATEPEQAEPILGTAPAVDKTPVSEPAITLVTESAPTEPAQATEENPVQKNPTTPEPQNADTEDVAVGGSSPVGTAPASYNDEQQVFEEDLGENVHIVDAEKFLTNNEDYDDGLCWAATAANMLWIAGYGREAVNPITGENFQDEDEIFDYFRQTFTDDGSDPSLGIRYFVEGNYEGQGLPDLSQLKMDQATNTVVQPGHLVSGMDTIPTNALKFYDQTDANLGASDVFTAAGDLAGKAVGVWVRYWKNNENAFDTNAHWATIWDVVKDTTNKVIGILLIDSDNNVVTSSPNVSAEDKQTTNNERRAELAASMPNSYTYYAIANDAFSATEDGVTAGYMKLISYGTDVLTALIGGITVLDSFPAYGGPGPDPESDDILVINPTKNEEQKEKQKEEQKSSDPVQQQTAINTIPEQAVPAVIDLNDPVIANAVIDAIKTIMIEKDMAFYAPSGNKFLKTSKKGYSAVIRRYYTSLANVFINGKRLPNNGKYYKITKTSNGMFIITFTPEYLRSLGDGEYSLRMDFVGAEGISTTIIVE